MFWLGVMSCAAVAVLAVACYREEMRQYKRMIHEEVQEQRLYYNAVMDAAWRQQLDREQLFREYTRDDKF
jgi:hypothetical protein